MSLYGVGLDVEVKKINVNFKMNIMKRGGIGIRSLGVIFRQMDNNGNKKLDLEEFTQALNTFGLFPKVVEVQALMKFYDVDGDGNISFDEFMRGLREPLTERRTRMVDMAWSIMDKDKSGEIGVNDVAHVFDVSCNQDFIDGKKTAEEVLADFLNGFDGVKGNNDGKITRTEWNDYYTDLSMSVTDDEYFVRMMESVWNVCEDESTTVSKQQIEELTRALRKKLLDFSKGQQDEYVLRGVFKEFDTNKNGTLSIDELANMFARLQISVERKYLQALLRKFDKNDNGIIEFEEFSEFLIQNSFK